MKKFAKWTLLTVLALVLTVVGGIAVWWNLGDWRERAISDVAFIHAQVKAHHPGPVDPENPKFSNAMERAYEKAMQLAETAETSREHEAALNAYVDAFEDGHFTVQHVNMAFDWAQSKATQSRPETSIKQDGASYWIVIPSFSENGSDIRALTEQIEARSAELREAEEIVFDLRGNGGGDSSFGNRIAVALWSRETVADWVPPTAGAVDYRASQENADHWIEVAKRNRSGGSEQNAKRLEDLAANLRRQVEAGEPFYRIQLREDETTRSVASPLQARVVALTDASCASACLDFMDNLKSLPGTTHLGSETGSDTQYIDVRKIDLPSNAGRLILPLKVWRDRVRPANGTYVPDLKIDPQSASWATIREATASLDRDR